MLLRSCVLLVALAYANPLLARTVPLTEKARALWNQGLAFDNESKSEEALKSFQAAALAEPTASGPLSSQADLYRRLSAVEGRQDAPALRERAFALANAALKLDAQDAIALHALRELNDDQTQAVYAPKAEAKKIVNEAEILFFDKKYAAAAEKYQLAFKLDPTYAEAVVLEGDCYYMLGDMVNAELKFRQALAIEPLHGAGWRFLYDALINQGKLKEAEMAAISAIAALPSATPSWTRMAHISDKLGPPLQTVNIKPLATMKGNTITIDNSAGANADTSSWMAYAIVMAAESEKPKSKVAFTRRLAIWEDTLQIIKEMGANKVKDPGLRAMMHFHQGGQLKAAIFLLEYKEAYRAEFEAWKKAEPDGIKRFIDTFHVTL